MIGYILIPIVFVSFVQAQEGDVIVSNNKTQCISQLVQWCNSMQYPQQGAGMTMLSITYEDLHGHYRVFCYSDVEGTNCTRNGIPWFACLPDHTLTYNGKALNNSSKDVDDEICKTADKAFNDLFVQNLSYDNTTLKTELEKGMESFFNQISAMQEQIEEIQKRLRSISFLNDDFWRGFEDGMFRDGDSTTPALAITKQNSTEQNNQIEKE